MHADAPSDRTWPLPTRKHAMRMRWQELLFAHWPFPPDPIQRWLPPGLTLDTWEGRAYVGVVPFRMSDVAPRGFPAFPGLSAFPELNVRTYVTVGGKPGVWFFSLDAKHRLAVRVARRWYHLPYMDARMECRRKTDGWVTYRSQRTHRGEAPAELLGRYRPAGEPFAAAAGSLEHFLTARYCLYAADRGSRLWRGEIDHHPWELQKAEAHFDSNTMLAPLELEPRGAAHLLYAHDLRVRAWTLQPCGESE